MSDAIAPKPLSPLSVAYPHVFQLPDYFLRLEVTPSENIVFRILTPDQFVKWLAGERVGLTTRIGLPVAAGETRVLERQGWIPGPQMLVIDAPDDPALIVSGVAVAAISRADLPGGGAPQVSDELEVDYNGWRRAVVTMACVCSEPCPHRRVDLMGREVNCACPADMRRADDRCPHDSRQILKPGEFQVDGTIQDGPLTGRAFGMVCSPGEEGQRWRWAPKRV